MFYSQQVKADQASFSCVPLESSKYSLNTTVKGPETNRKKPKPLPVLLRPSIICEGDQFLLTLTTLVSISFRGLAHLLKDWAHQDLSDGDGKLPQILKQISYRRGGLRPFLEGLMKRCWLLSRLKSRSLSLGTEETSKNIPPHPCKECVYVQHTHHGIYSEIHEQLY